MNPEQYRDDELLRRWISGAITAPEEAELERRAAGDDGLREAFDALRNDADHDHQHRIAALLDRARPATSRRTLLPRYAAAAAILLLLGVATLLLPHYYAEEDAAAIAMDSSKEPPAPAPRRPLPPPPPPAPETTAEAVAPAPEVYESEEPRPQPQSAAKDPALPAEPAASVMARDAPVPARMEQSFRTTAVPPIDSTDNYRTLRTRIERERPADLSPATVEVNFLRHPDGSLSDFRFPPATAPAIERYIRRALVDSPWEPTDRTAPVRVYLKLRFE
ncbi:hypothetical protein [Lewinella sp. JB7]|uniref:hypothetical protein n=1 Tax=Lewinella sp. JB7 TaxID=2962887 RepID=UPI0020CA20E6|nr:hypothetical protein [Lewinella sp. JB7]MCP9237798.1 hypothetical protein [Lewinella sp. JB7]